VPYRSERFDVVERIRLDLLESYFSKKVIAIKKGGQIRKLKY